MLVAHCALLRRVWTDFLDDFFFGTDRLAYTKFSVLVSRCVVKSINNIFVVEIMGMMAKCFYSSVTLPSVFTLNILIPIYFPQLNGYEMDMMLNRIIKEHVRGHTGSAKYPESHCG